MDVGPTFCARNESATVESAFQEKSTAGALWRDYEEGFPPIVVGGAEIVLMSALK